MSTDSDAEHSVETGSVPISGDHFTQLMAALHASQDGMDGQFTEFREECDNGN